MKHEINDEHGFQRYFPYRIVDDTCGIPDRDAVIDQYISGELTDIERDAFDEHTFFIAIPVSKRCDSGKNCRKLWKQRVNRNRQFALWLFHPGNIWVGKPKAGRGN